MTVIVPVFNAAETLGATLRSAAGQTYPDMEILIVDDGSTDHSAMIAANFCATEPRASLIRQSNEGVASARNRGIEEARGNWIAPLDADDVWHPEKIERQIATFARSGSDLGLVYCWYRTTDQSGKVIGPSWAPVFEGRVFDVHLENNFVGTASSPLIKRTALRNVRYNSELRKAGNEGCEDWLLQLEIASKFEFACTRAFLTGYRAGLGRMSADADRMIRSQMQMYRILFRDEPGRADRFIRKQIARMQATDGLRQLRRGRMGRAYKQLAGSLSSSQSAALDELLVQTRRRLRRLIRSKAEGKFFMEISPDT